VSGGIVLNSKALTVSGQGPDKAQSFIVLLVMACAVWLSMNVEKLGWRIIKDIPEMVKPTVGLDYAMGVFWWAVLAILLLVLGGDSRRMLLVGWVGKFFVTLIAMLFYEDYYGLDSYAYFEMKLTGIHWMYPGHDFRYDLLPVLKAKTLAGMVGNENALRFILMVGTVMGPFYHAMKVGCAFVGFMGIWFFYRAVVVAMGRAYPPAFYLLAFFPSILFWSSTLGKDPIQFFFLSLYAYGASLWLVEGRLRAFGFLGAGLIGSYLIRPWMTYMGGLALGLAFLLARARLIQLVFVVVLCIPFFYWGGELFMEQYGFESQEMLLDYIQALPKGFAKTASGIGEEKIRGDYFDAEKDNLAIYWPWAFFSGLFRPLPFDITNAFTALAAVENTIILWLTLRAFVKSRLTFLRDPLVLWPLFFTCIWAALYGFIVAANFGAGARYKLQTWPFFLMVIVCLNHRDGRALLMERLKKRRSQS